MRVLRGAREIALVGMFASLVVVGSGLIVDSIALMAAVTAVSLAPVLYLGIAKLRARLRGRGTVFTLKQRIQPD